jgi:hypothetical protein
VPNGAAVIKGNAALLYKFILGKRSLHPVYGCDESSDPALMKYLMIRPRCSTESLQHHGIMLWSLSKKQASKQAAVSSQLFGLLGAS